MILRFGHLVPELIKKVYKIWQWLTKKGFFLPLVKNYKILKKCWNNRFSWIIGRYPNLSTIVKFINHLSIQRKIIGSKRGTTVTARGRVQHTQLGHLWFCANESFKRTVAGSISRVVGANWSWAWPLQCTHAVSISRKKDSLFVDWSSKCVFISRDWTLHSTWGDSIYWWHRSRNSCLSHLESNYIVPDRCMTPVQSSKSFWDGGDLF